MYRHWLVAHDFEACSNSAADAAARVARACSVVDDRARVVLAHVVTPTILPVPGDVGSGAALAAIDAMVLAATEQLDNEASNLRQRFPDVTIDTMVLTGTAVEAIMAYADRINVDAIAVGTHGRTGLKHAFMGSVAERIVQHAQRPVLVIKEPHATFAGAVA
jgi:nucleotide-binding universal stress UspA family protein